MLKMGIQKGPNMENFTKENFEPFCPGIMWLRTRNFIQLHYSTLCCIAMAQSHVYNGASNAPINISDMEDSRTIYLGAAEQNKEMLFSNFSCRFLSPNNFFQFELYLFYFLRSEKPPGTS